MSKSKVAPIRVGELSDLKCPLCGRFYPEGYIEHTEPFNDPKECSMCIRCFLGTVAIKEMARVGNNEELLDALIEHYDVDYEKALERKLTVDEAEIS